LEVNNSKKKPAEKKKRVAVEPKTKGGGRVAPPQGSDGGKGYLGKKKLNNKKERGRKRDHERNGPREVRLACTRTPCARTLSPMTGVKRLGREKGDQNNASVAANTSSQRGRVRKSEETCT